ncbi:metal-dependent hydrolase [Salinirubrum litoreum]|uniref:Metal-dependent hydrolase n=1 Tax=Salinirubrum litoreum TaxID=1126234 RepID=A0ABD5R882_9EURY
MPSTVVHVAVAGLVGCALLADDFSPRAIGVVLLAAVVPDLDTFAGLVLPGAHRSLLHTLLLPALLAAVLLWDTRLAATSRLRARWGESAPRVAWVAVAGLLAGGIAPDLFTNGVNAFYPLHDAFYTVNGELLLSDQRGVVQTFVELQPEQPPQTTETIHYSTGVDPSPGREPENVERIFPVAASGTQLLLILLGTGSVLARLWTDRDA